LDVYLQDSGGGWQLSSRGAVSASQTPRSIDPDTGVAPYAVPQPAPIEMRPLPPLALQRPPGATGNPSFGQQYTAAVRDAFEKFLFSPSDAIDARMSVHARDVAPVWRMQQGMTNRLRNQCDATLGLCGSQPAQEGPY
jgi:hypothetical protein